MGKLLSFFQRNKTAPVSNHPHKHTGKDLDPRQLPPMSAPELIQYLELENQIRAIQRLSSVNDHYWHTLYRQSINNAAELIQLIPASGSHHHAGPGGLLTHTIEVCANTMRIAKAYQLPLGVGPEERARLDQVWRYGLFVAALLHDIGKTLALVQITLTMRDGSRQLWSPYLGAMPGSTKCYQITFQAVDYQLHHQLSVSLMDVLPPKARHWLLQDKKLIKQLMAWLSHDPYECGVIGEIVRQADMESTAADLKLGGHKMRFPGTFELPLIDRLMTALRHLLHEGSLKINRNGAALWLYQGNAYLVCRTVAHAVQHYLQDNGATDIPEDPTRLYDTWQESGYAQSNAQGGAIHKVAIQGEDYQLSLTVMIFEAHRLFKVGHVPNDLVGHIEILSQDTPVKELSQSSDTKTDQTEAAPTPPLASATTPQSAAQAQHADPFDMSNNAPSGDTETASNNPLNTGTAPSASNTPQSGTNTAPEPGELYTPEIQNSAAAAPLSGTNNKNTGAMPQDKNLAQIEEKYSIDSGAAPVCDATIPDPDDPGIGEYFIHWVKRSIQDKSLRINRADTPVHIIDQGVILISPIILKKFCSKMGFEELTKGKATWKLVQARFHKLKLHIRTDNHVNIHKFQIKGDNRTSHMNGYLMPFEIFYPEDQRPAVNKKILHVG